MNTVTLQLPKSVVFDSLCMMLARVSRNRPAKRIEYTAVVAPLFGHLKRDCILKGVQLTREHVKQDLLDCGLSHNSDQLHTVSGDRSPDKRSLSQIKVFING